MKKWLLRVIIILISCISWAEGLQHSALVVNPNSNQLLTAEMLKDGTGYILVKPNPPRLTGNELILQTGQYNLYASANIQDLKNQGAFRNILAAKFNKNGTIKVYTLANVGYAKISLPENSDSNQVFLVNNRNEKAAIQNLTLPFVNHPIYDPLTEILKIKR